MDVLGRKDLRGADFQEANFEEANLDGANLKKAALFSIFNTSYFSNFRQHENS